MIKNFAAYLKIWIYNIIQETLVVKYNSVIAVSIDDVDHGSSQESM